MCEGIPSASDWDHPRNNATKCAECHSEMSEYFGTIMSSQVRVTPGGHAIMQVVAKPPRLNGLDDRA